jgi:hypothetical protein
MAGKAGAGKKQRDGKRKGKSSPRGDARSPESENLPSAESEVADVHSANPGMSNGTMSLATTTMASSRRLSTWKKIVAELRISHRKLGSFAGLFGCRKRCALDWGRPSVGTAVEGSELQRDLRKMGRTLGGHRKLRKGDAGWLDRGLPRDKSAEVSVEQALYALAIASLMPRLAAVAEESRWWHALRTLLALTDSSRPLGPGIALRQLLTVELPLVLARQLAIVPACRELARPAKELLVLEQAELLDSDGWLRATHMDEFPVVLACWTRCQRLLDSLGLQLSKESQNNWEWLVRQALRMLREDGSFAFGPTSVSGNEDLAAAAVGTSRSKKDREIAKIVCRAQDAMDGRDIREKRENLFSEWAGAGILRSHWNRNSPRVAVIADGQNCRLEFGRGNVMLSADTNPSVAVNGVRIQPCEPWSVTCDHNDKDIEFLEMQIRFDGNVTLQRQILLARKDKFLFLADVVLGPAREELEYRQTYRIGSPLTVLGESETREVYLMESGKLRALVLPLALPEWKTAFSRNALVFSGNEDEGSLVLSQAALARNMYAGLFIDLSANRSSKPRTWRQLTVAEQLKPVASDIAVAWRVRTGRDQFVFYRTLAQAGNRTFIGQNFSGEFFVGKLNKEGLCDDLIRIDA